MASVVWTRPLDTEFGPLDDVPEREREQLWPAARRQRLLERLPERRAMERTRFGTCAVVGSSPELLLYSDGAAIDAHDAVFRANMAVTAGYEEHAGRRTSVRIVNPVEDVFKARKRSEDGTEIIIKNQDPPVIRSPSEQHGRFLGQAEKEPDKPNYLGRRQALGRRTRMACACACIRALPQLLELRPCLPPLPSLSPPCPLPMLSLCSAYALPVLSHGPYCTAPMGQVLELCNFLFVMSGLALPPEPAKGRGRAKAPKAARAEQAARDEGWSAAVLNQTLDSFRKYVADGRSEWHPLGPKIPRFSQSHCSTGTVLLVEALLLCRTTRLYGFHACGCSRKCGGAEIAGRNHYWDKKSTPRLDDMMSRYERHMLFYQLLERACGLDFRIARTEHCDAYPPS